MRAVLLLCKNKREMKGKKKCCELLSVQALTQWDHDQLTAKSYLYSKRRPSLAMGTLYACLQKK